MPSQFSKLILTRFLFTLATQIQAVAIGWRMYELTQEPLSLGLVGLSEAAPAIGLAMLAGYLVDRGSPTEIYRRLMLVSLASGAVLFLSQSGMFELGAVTRVAALFVSSMLTGVTRAFAQPTMYSLVPRLVVREDLARSSAQMSSTLQVARVSGPAVGGILYAACGIGGTGLVICAVLAVGYWCAGMLPIIERNKDEGAVRSRGAELLMGARFVWQHPILLPALSLDMISVLFGGVTALLPIYAAEVLFVGPRGLGALRAGGAVGAAVVSLALTHVDIRANAGRWLMTAVTGFGIAIIVFALSSSFWLSFVALAVSGGFDSVSVVVRSSAVQLSSPENMRGRISAINSMFISSSNEIGEFESGVMAHLLGLVPAAVVGGIACLVTVAVVAIRSPTLRGLNLRKLEEESPA